MNLNVAIESIRNARETLKSIKDENGHEPYLLEAEFLYQLISVTMEMNQHLHGGYFSIDLMEEKFDTLKRLSQSIFKEKQKKDI
jgi:hypothetical protein